MPYITYTFVSFTSFDFKILVSSSLTILMVSFSLIRLMDSSNPQFNEIHYVSAPDCFV